MKTTNFVIVGEFLGKFWFLKLFLLRGIFEIIYLLFKLFCNFSIENGKTLTRLFNALPYERLEQIKFVKN